MASTQGRVMGAPRCEKMRMRRARTGRHVRGRCAGHMRGGLGSDRAATPSGGTIIEAQMSDCMWVFS